MKSRGASNNRPGFTLIELIVTLAIFAITAATIMPFVGRFQNAQTIKTHAQSVVQILRRAQHRALIGERDSAWGIQFQTGAYMLYAGTSYAGRNSHFDEMHSVAAVFHFEGLPEVVFQKGTGKPVAPGTVTITHANGLAQSITIGASGLISLP